MADELDKFVLSYTVEMKDAISRLEQLNQKIEKTGKTSSKVGGQVKDFATGASDELGKLIPGVDKVSAAIKMLGAEFAVAGLAVGALAVGVKSVMDMREQFNQQRKEGMDIGVSVERLEEYQRKFAKTSRGHITREQTAEEVKKLADFSSAVYRDPTRIGTEARTARVLGINMGAPGQHIGINALMTQIGEKFSKMTDAQVQAQAKNLGMNQDFALALKKQGGTVGQITETTPAEFASRKAAQEQLANFDTEMTKLGENFKKAENALAVGLLPALNTFVTYLTKLSDSLPKELITVSKAASMTLEAMPGTMIFRKISSLFGGNKPDEHLLKKTSQETSAATKEQTKMAENLKKTFADEDKTNADARAISDQNALAINQFAGAVASFANAVDEKQAWAAWAGEIGKASGLGTSVSGESRAKIQIKSVQNTIAQRLGVPVQQLQQGGINRGDVKFASSQLEAGIQNQIYDLKNQLKAVNLPQQTRSKIMNEIRAQQSGLAMMRQYSGQVSEKAQEGGRSITIGERAVVINVNGASNPAATAAHVQAALSDHLGEIVNGTSTAMKL